MNTVTDVTINNPLNGETHRFDFDKSTFMEYFNNHITAVGYFKGETICGKSVLINPSHCAVIRIEEVRLIK